MECGLRGGDVEGSFSLPTFFLYEFNLNHRQHQVTCLDPETE